MQRFRLRDCYRPLDYFLFGTIAGFTPIAFEFGFEVPAEIGLLAALYLATALLVVAVRSGRAAGRLA